ncbi:MULTISPECIES: H-NS family nucleoid-associated regulatory protein [unclassified Rubrivivax]|uniref:H-NS histone family protein n=1 Tax=unclassified Rubrivivax TaxID=2649762 RepID=UPI001E5E01B3|nr:MULTISPECIES: H-NS histone family protein [unclassified Rubrivivax]MCC9598391.1 H-NS histone family protein [Rubrivivax sp. JA1055]MCC9648091.1 H-NS histone family protein [Rubrivivax sp. JA1029]MCD0422989.1 H-NS histone family protein [Rubrivivax sp. JA1024]
MATKKNSAPTATYAEIQAQIEKLQAEAEALRKKEIADVVAGIKAQIAEYGLTAADLGLAPKASRSRKPAGKALYADGQGNTWVGRGKRPEWIRAALAAGKTLDELRAQ